MLRSKAACGALAFILLASPCFSTAAARAGRPVVVELFTSQGCSACVGANGLTQDLDGRKDVLALTLPVDYWDYLGWRDTFAQPAFSDRQRAYMKALGSDEVYTPQIVVDGAAQTVKSQGGAALADQVQAMIRRAAHAHVASPAIVIGARAVRIGEGHAPHGGADVWLVRFDPAPAAVQVKEGENRGRSLAFHNVVKTLVRLGPWTGKPRRFLLPKPDSADLKTAILVQGRLDARILAAARP